MAYRYSTNVSKTDTAASKRRPASGKPSLAAAVKNSARNSNALNERLPSGNSSMASDLRASRPAAAKTAVRRGTAVNTIKSSSGYSANSMMKKGTPISEANAKAALSAMPRKRTVQKTVVKGMVKRPAK